MKSIQISVLYLLILFSASSLFAEETTSIQADATNQSLGIQKFVVDVSENGEPSLAFIQVVGDASSAGSLLFSEVPGGYEVAVRMSRSGQSLTVGLDQDLRGGYVEDAGQIVAWWDFEQQVVMGVDGLENNDAWNSLWHVVDDANLSPGLVDAGGPGPDIDEDCNSVCRTQHPVPADCQGFFGTS